METITCAACGKATLKENRTVCQYCGFPFENKWDSKYVSTSIAAGLTSVGWIYFLLSILGSIALLVNVKQKVYVRGVYETVTNEMFIVFGIAGVMSSILVLLICLGIARAIEQNVFIIRHLKNI